MDSYSKKIVDKFKGKVVRKDLTNLMKRGANVPGYVLEYLLGMYCATDDQNVINVGLKKISNILSTNYVRYDEIEKTKYLLSEKGEYTIIDKVFARVDEDNNLFVGSFANFTIGDFILEKEYAQKYMKLFTGGVWCMVKIKYDKYKLNDDEDTEKVKEEIVSNLSKKRKVKSYFNTPYSIIGLKPIQVPNLNIDSIIEARKDFTFDEWMLLILRSCGIEALNLNEKERFHFIERIVPLFERNYNLVELGPRGTGKSHIYKEISPYSILLSGAHSSISNMFYNMSRRTVGLVGNWDVIGFDEIAGMGFSNPEGIQIIKDYMASGSFSRGREVIYADASMVFLGNINDTVENLLKVSNLFSPFPETFRKDSAFFDRMHYYLPGWEVPKIRADYLTEEFGFISDCFAEFAKEMRKQDFTHIFDQWFKFNKNVTTRDEIAIRKTVSGITKILFPDMSFTKDDMEKILIYAIEGRRRVKEQLRKIAGDEFADVDLGFIRDDGKEVIVNVPEKALTTLVPKTQMSCGHICTVAYSRSFEVPAVYRIEIKKVIGSGKIEVQGVQGYGKSAAMESVNAGWKYFIENSKKVSPDIRNSIYDYDFLVYVNDMQRKSSSTEISIAEFIALCSISLEKPVLSEMVVIGEVTLSGTVKEVKAVEDYIRMAYNSGAYNIILPYTCKMDVEKIKDENLKRLNVMYYYNPIDAAQIALGLKEN